MVYGSDSVPEITLTRFCHFYSALPSNYIQMDSVGHVDYVEPHVRSKKKTGNMSNVTLPDKEGVHLKEVQQPTSAENVLIP